MNSGNDDILNIIENRALKNRAKVAIGIREPNEKLISSVNAAHNGRYAHVILVGDRSKIREFNTELDIIDTQNPEKMLASLLVSGKVDAAVRGTAHASEALANLKRSLKMESIQRLALLITASGNCFFLAPVGIDESGSIADRINFILNGARHIRRFGIEPSVGILSGGRLGDLGRDNRVDRTLADADFITNRLHEKGINAKHYTILIEDAIKEANFIFAPDGISGNLIFRTLVFLGGGDGIGAPVLMDDYVFVDTSRVGGHYTKAIMLASALADISDPFDR